MHYISYSIDSSPWYSHDIPIIVHHSPWENARLTTVAWVAALALGTIITAAAGLRKPAGVLVLWMFYGCLWCFLVFYNVSWFSLDVFMMFHDVAWCFIMFHDVFWMFHDVPWCFMMFHDVSYWSMMFNDVPWCLMMFYDVWWCFMMFHDVLWCLMMFYDVLFLFYVL